jgi:cell division protein FtsQ
MPGEFVCPPGADRAVKTPAPPDERRGDGDLPPPVSGPAAFPEEENAGEGRARSGRGLERGVKVLIAAAASVLVLELVWLLAISPCMPLSRIEVTGFPGLERAEILRQAGVGERASYVSVDRRAVEKNLEKIKEVESARVTKHFPGTLKILVLPRTPVAVAFTVEGGRRVPLYLDRHGVAFKTVRETRSLPVISGLSLAEGETLSPLYLPLFASLDRIRYADAELLGTVSEITINKKLFDGFDLVLYPVHSPIRVRLESALNEETLRYVMLMLDVLSSNNQEIEEIDFRTGTASYRLKEVPSGQ